MLAINYCTLSFFNRSGSVLAILRRVKCNGRCQGGGSPKIRALRVRKLITKLKPITKKLCDEFISVFQDCPHPSALHIIMSHKANVLMRLHACKSKLTR